MRAFPWIHPLQHDNKVSYSASIFFSLPSASMFPLNLLLAISLRARSPSSIDVLNSASSIELETYYCTFLYSWKTNQAHLTHNFFISVSSPSACTLPVSWLLLMTLHVVIFNSDGIAYSIGFGINSIEKKGNCTFLYS